MKQKLEQVITAAWMYRMTKSQFMKAANVMWENVDETMFHKMRERCTDETLSINARTVMDI